MYARKRRAEALLFAFVSKSAVVIFLAVLQVVAFLIFLLGLLLFGVVLLILIVLVVHSVIVLSVKLHGNPFGLRNQYEAVCFKIFPMGKNSKKYSQGAKDVVYSKS